MVGMDLTTSSLPVEASLEDANVDLASANARVATKELAGVTTGSSGTIDRQGGGNRSGLDKLLREDVHGFADSNCTW
jgi:hypothetical protein